MQILKPRIFKGVRCSVFSVQFSEGGYWKSQNPNPKKVPNGKFQSGIGVASRPRFDYCRIVDEASRQGQREAEGYGHGVLQWVVAVAVLLIAYPLSTGPAVKLTQGG